MSLFGVPPRAKRGQPFCKEESERERMRENERDLGERESARARERERERERERLSGFVALYSTYARALTVEIWVAHVLLMCC
jgi:hypothetical protein